MLYENIDSHQKFKKKYNIKFNLLADEKKDAIKGYKTWGKKKFMGREFMGLIRSTFVIKDQKIIKEWIRDSFQKLKLFHHQKL